ncbi:MAG: hypothetical protein E7208_08070 [Clostridium butyricum]|nr:hypothetical protein [Clostridium butyricum]
MKPYNLGFIHEKIEKYNSIINKLEFEGCSVCKDKVNLKETNGYMCEMCEDYSFDRIKLFKGKEFIMEISPKEIQGSYNAIKYARGKVGVVGLGFGYVVQEMAKKDSVEEILVYEISKEIIEIYKKHFKDNHKIKIINIDAYKAKKEKFDFFFVDTYGYELTLKVVEDYKKFNTLHEIEEYSFWGVEHFLLSCKYEDLLWIFVPENWVEMSKKLYEALDMSGNIGNYRPLNEDLVTNVLMQFKSILND